MSKVWKIALILSCSLNLILGFVLLDRPKVTSTYKIDSLEHVIDSLQVKRDSIKSNIDTVKIILNNTEEKYEKDRDIILNNSVTDDYIFFTNYLERFCNRNNSDSVKNN